jgi:hypothetical protein
MAQAVKPIEDDPLPPAVPARSRRPSAADAAHQEVVRQRREHEASQIVGNTQDSDSPRLQKRRAHKARLAPQPLGSRPRGVVMTDADLDGVADSMASEVGEFDPLSDDDMTADMEQSENADS